VGDSRGDESAAAVLGAAPAPLPILLATRDECGGGANRERRVVQATVAALPEPVGPLFRQQCAAE